MDKDVLVIIPNYNGEKFIAETLSRLKIAMPSYPILVVDDKSTDHSIKVIQKVPDCSLICKSINGGFASSVNVGINFAVQSSFRSVLVFNSDIFLDIETGAVIDSAIRRFLSESEVGVLGFLEAGTEQMAKNFSDCNISGFLFCLKLEIPKSIGLFDELFFMYGEEQDFFRRTVEAGYVIRQSGISVPHKTEGSSSSMEFTSYLAMRNAIYLELKQKKYFVALKKLLAILAILLGLRHRGSKDPSIVRLRRPPLSRALILLFKAVIWNMNFLRRINFEPK